MEAINDAVLAHLADLNPGSLLTGWVLSYSFTSYDDDGDLAFAQNYSCSDGTDTARAVGIIEIIRAKLRRDLGLLHYTDDDD